MAEPMSPERRTDIRRRSERHHRLWEPPPGTCTDAEFLDLCQLIDKDVPDLLDALDELTAPMAKPEISPAIAAHVLRCYGEGGYEPGPWVQELILLIRRADASNRALLALAFPAYVRAVNAIEATPTGVAELRDIAAAGERDD